MRVRSPPRAPAWRKKDLDAALRVSPADAERMGVTSGGTAVLSTKRSNAVVAIAVDDTVQPGHISLPNGFGLDHPEDGARMKTGVGTNEFTASEDRDPWAGTPWHKTTPARLEPVCEGLTIGRAVAGVKMLDTYRELSATATFNQCAGLDVIRMSEGECELALPWRAEEMGQYSGFLHAGLVAAVLDTACSFAAHTLAQGGVLSSHVAINCLAPAVGKEFHASGRVVKAGRKQIFTAGELLAIEDGRSKLVATASAILVPTG